ncbi:MAG TPA: hypothetical protein P5266_07890, partial [Candidatus Fermentibacter sp.]|nr:hypothetical protein [Candidatus Fermentibacter sp.]
MSHEDGGILCRSSRVGITGGSCGDLPGHLGGHGGEVDRLDAVVRQRQAADGDARAVDEDVAPQVA